MPKPRKPRTTSRAVTSPQVGAPARPRVTADLVTAIVTSIGVAAVLVYVGGERDALGIGMRGAAIVGVAVFAVAAGVALSLSWRRQSDWSRVEHTLATRTGRDPLTGLPDRVALTERLSAGLGDTRTPTASRPAVLFCDLDRFRRINDTYGHACGDNVLVAAGQRFANALRAGDTIGRLDGDKFVVICPVVSTSEAAEVANRLLATLENPFAVGGHTVRVTASIGVAVADGSTAGPDALLRDADHAMVQAKRDGRERAVIFSSSMRRRSSVGGIEQLRVALEDGQFRLVYQPVVSSFDGSIVGLEALLRWDHPELGVVSPGDFVPQLEESGLIVDVGTWVLREACRQAAEWTNAFPELGTRVTVNVSARQLAEPDFRQTVAERAGRGRAAPAAALSRAHRGHLAPRHGRGLGTPA